MKFALVILAMASSLLTTQAFAQDGGYGEVMKAVADLDSQIAGLTQVLQGLQATRDKLQSSLNGVYSATVEYTAHFGTYQCAELNAYPDTVKETVDLAYKVAELKCQGSGAQNCLRSDFFCRDIHNGNGTRANFTVFVRAAAPTVKPQPQQ